MAVSFNYIPSNIRVPLFYAEMDNSMANTATADKKSLLIGQMSSDGAATAGTPVYVGSAAKAKTLFGRGSPLALMAEAYRNQDSSGELWCIPMSVKGTAASGKIAVAGTALASGTIAIYIGGVKVPVTVAAGDAASAVEQAIIAAVNAAKDLPVTASDSDGTAVLAAKAQGIYGNDIQIATNLQGAVGGEEDVSGIRLTITAMADGAGEAAYKDAFAAVNTEAYWYIGIQDCDATVLDACKDEMNDSTGRWSYARMQYGHVWSAKRGDAEALITFGKTRNDQHASVFGVEPENPVPAFVLAAAVTGRAAVFFTNDPARPLQTGILSGLMVPAVEKRFSLADRNSLLHNGIATCYHSGGYTRIEREITTYQTNSFGDADNSYLDATTLYTLAEIVTELKTAVTSKYARHKLANDGTRFGAGQAIVTPKVIRSELIAQYASMEERGLVENADLFAKYLVVERDNTDVNRLNVLLPPDLVNQLRVFALLAQFRLQYSDEA